MEMHREIKVLRMSIVNLENLLKELIKKIDDQETRIKALEDADVFERLGIKKIEEDAVPNPWEPKSVPAPYIPDVPWVSPPGPPIIRKCSKCGLQINGVMGYACPNIDCPVGLGPVSCGGNDV